MDYELTQADRARLSAFLNTDEFKILDSLMKSEVFKFNTALLNEKEPEKVLQAHNLAKAAASFYQGLVNRINAEAYIYKNTPRPGDDPIDITEGALDLDGTF
jgi:hypothetical protein